MRQEDRQKSKWTTIAYKSLWILTDFIFAKSLLSPKLPFIRPFVVFYSAAFCVIFLCNCIVAPLYKLCLGIGCVLSRFYFSFRFSHSSFGFTLKLWNAHAQLTLFSYSVVCCATAWIGYIYMYIYIYMSLWTVSIACKVTTHFNTILHIPLIHTVYTLSETMNCFNDAVIFLTCYRIVAFGNL